MSRARREPYRHSVRVVRKRSNKRLWLAFLILILIFIGLLIGIIFLILSTP